METGRNARRVRLLMAAIILSGVLGTNASMLSADPPGEPTCVLRVGDVTFEFARIPAGRFLMGSSAGSRDERPAHEVTFANEFYLGRTEVTVRQFRAFAEATGYQTDAEQMGWAYNCPLPGLHPHERGLSWRRPGFEPNDALPAVVISRTDAAAFCRWLSERTGRTCRLPTEAEWEYAARAGRQDDAADSLDKSAWYEDNTSNSPYPVATRAANAWGLHDMQGNAAEWCADVWRPDYKGVALDGSARMNDPTTPPAIWRYVLRGGGWASPKENLRLGYRYRRLVSFADPATGFRIVLDPPGRTASEGRMGNSVAHADAPRVEEARTSVHAEPTAAQEDSAVRAVSSPIDEGRTTPHAESTTRGKDAVAPADATRTEASRAAAPVEPTAGEEDRMGRGPAHPTSAASPRARGGLSTDSQTGRTILATHGVQFEFVRIPAGEFLMGMEEGDIEKPVHKVRIGGDFEMARTEVTVAQFRAFVEATGYMTDGEKWGSGSVWRAGQDWTSQEAANWRDTGSPQTDEHAVSFVSWYDAMAFCHWLSAETGQEIRLPSESEWEYACRAGTTGAYAGSVNGMGWHRFNSGGRTHPVAQKRPNAWGLYDMHGNVWEWCLDFFTTSYQGAPADGSPRWDLRPATDVVSRGGSLGNPPGWLGSAVRMGSFPDCSHYNNGFRLVRVLKGSATTASSKPAASGALSTPAQAQSDVPALVPVETQLPRQVFPDLPGDGTPIGVPRLAPVQKEPGPPLLAPPGTTNIALGKPVSASDQDPIIGAPEMITDGNKEARGNSYVELGPGLQHITIDLRGEYEIYGIRLWHYHQQPRVYFDVVVQVSHDSQFRGGVKTVFNNDIDNSAGLGVGTDLHHAETFWGQLLRTEGAHGRYVRLYSHGNSANDLNHYIEVEVYGKPVGPVTRLIPLVVNRS